MGARFEVIGSFVTRRIVPNECLIVVDSKSEFCTRFTYVIATTIVHAIKYTTLDDLHENDPGLAIDVVPGSVRENLVSIKWHILHLYHI